MLTEGLCLLTLILFTLSIIYRYLMSKLDYWQKRGVSGPKPLPLIGNSFSFIFTPIISFELNWVKKYGSIYGIYYYQKPILTVADPELIKTILVKDFHIFTDRKHMKFNNEIIDKHIFYSSGDHWKRLRSIISPTFTSGKMRKMYPMVRECVTQLINYLETAAKNKQNINVKEMFGNYTIDVIASCAFATKINSSIEGNHPFVSNAKKFEKFNIWGILLYLILPKYVLKVLRIQSLNYENYNQLFINFLREIYYQRKLNPNSSKQFTDFMQLLVDAEIDEKGIQNELDMKMAHYINQGKEEMAVEQKTFNINVINKRLTEDEIIAQEWIILLAGYETTTTTISYCLYELALNPDIQERLYQEIQSNVDSNGEFSYDELAKLSFLDAVLSETLRMYPPVLRLERKCSTDYKLGNSGIHLSKGQDIEIPIYAIHHCEDYYPNPKCFIPERFLPKNRHNITPYTFLPFGAGPRNCVGMRFALMEIKLCLVHILSRYQFFRTEQTAIPLEFKSILLLSIPKLFLAKEVVIGIEKRKYSQTSKE